MRPVRDRKRPRRTPGYVDTAVVALSLSDDDEPDTAKSDTDADYADRPDKKRARKSTHKRQTINSRESSIPPPKLPPVITRLTVNTSPPRRVRQARAEKTVQQKFTKLIKPYELKGNRFGKTMDVTGFDGEVALQKPIKLKMLIPGPPNQYVDVAIDFSQLSMHCKVAISATYRNATSSGQNGAIANMTGFLSFSGEIRNRVYGFLFCPPGAANTVDFLQRLGFERSGQFLRTCKQVQLEGSGLLYGENKFTFGRECEKRGQFYEREWSEIGYQDAYRFLYTIGPTNISFLRKIQFSFQDATSTTCPNVTTNQRRCVNDPYLLQSLKLLGKHGKLTNIKLHYEGRRTLLPKDRKFVKALKQIQADHVVFGEIQRMALAGSGSLGKVKNSLTLDIWEAMTRNIPAGSVYYVDDSGAVVCKGPQQAVP